MFRALALLAARRPPLPKPAAPSALGLTVLATESALTGIQLDWTDNAFDEEGFRIQRQVDGGGWDDNFANVGANVTTYDDLTATTSGSVYEYRVRSRIASVLSAASNVASITPVTPGSPLAPSGLTAEETVLGDILLNWIDNSDNEDDFRIWRRVNGGSLIPLAIVGANVTTYQDVTVDPETSYCYAVQARRDGGALASDFSNEACVDTLPLTPAAPVDVTATATSDTEVTLEWTPPEGPVTSWDIFRDGEPYATNIPASTYPDSYPLQGLTEGSLHAWSIRGVNSTENGALSAESSTTTWLAAPSNFVVIENPDNATQLQGTWTDNSSKEDGYEVWDLGPDVLVAAVGASETAATWAKPAEVLSDYSVTAVSATLPNSDESNTASYPPPE